MRRWIVFGLAACAPAAAAQNVPRVPPGVNRPDSSQVAMVRGVLLTPTAADTAAIRRAAAGTVAQPDTVALWRINIRIDGDNAEATIPNNVAGGTIITVRHRDGKWVAENSVRVFYSR